MNNKKMLKHIYVRLKSDISYSNEYLLLVLYNFVIMCGICLLAIFYFFTNSNILIAHMGEILDLVKMTIIIVILFLLLNLFFVIHKNINRKDNEVANYFLFGYSARLIFMIYSMQYTFYAILGIVVSFFVIILLLGGSYWVTVHFDITNISNIYGLKLLFPSGIAVLMILIINFFAVALYILKLRKKSILHMLSN